MLINKVWLFKLKRTKLYQSGFALPTILIASVVMLIVLAAAVQATVASGSAIKSQYYNQLASTAAESGVVKAQTCLGSNNYIATWTDAKPLKPNTDCNGDVVSGASEYVLESDQIRTSFSVPYPEDYDGTQKITASGTAALVRKSSGQTWRQYNRIAYAMTGAQVSFDSVTFGYFYWSETIQGAFFAVIDSNRDVKAVGYNGDGQLGNGTTAATTTPQSFALPSGQKARSLFTSFLSIGRSIFAITNDGSAYGAGANEVGQLGIGYVTTNQTTPVKFNLPSGVKAQFIGVSQFNTYVIGSDNNIYAAGSCADGRLGSNYTISGCSDKATPVRVALPTVNTSDSNTLPVASSDFAQDTNLAIDSVNVYVRMQGGRVYGWGVSGRGQLANGSTSSSSLPVKIGNYGDTGQPKATQVAFDGETVYILDDSGKVSASGRNDYGQLAGAAAPVQNSTGLCLDNSDNSSTPGSIAQAYTCHGEESQAAEWATDGAIKFRPNTTTELCLDNYGGSFADGNSIVLYTCNGTAAQQWRLREDGSIYNPSSGKCLDVPGASTTPGVDLQLFTCNGTAAQIWTLRDSLKLSNVPIPSSAGKVIRITTDQWSVLFLTESGQVWGAGLNEKGQLGNGATSIHSQVLTQFKLPAGRTAVNFYNTKAKAFGWDPANTYVVLDDGSVYGAGSNTYGQLGNGTVSSYEADPKKMNLPSGARAKSVQSGLSTTVVLTDTGKIYTVGNNSNGQLGDGTTNSSSTPRANQYTNVIPLVTF